MFLVFKPPEPVDVLLFGLVFTDDVDGVFFLVEGVDLVIHEVRNIFFLEFDGDNGAAFFLEPEGVFFHVQGGDSAGDAPDLADLLALFYIVFEDLGDGAVSLWGMVKVLRLGWRVQVISRERSSLSMSW